METLRALRASLSPSLDWNFPLSHPADDGKLLQEELCQETLPPLIPGGGFPMAPRSLHTPRCAASIP